MTFVAAPSQHPVPAHAVGEVAGRVLDAAGPAPDLAVLFVGGSLTGALDDIVAALRTLLRPVVLVGCTAAAVMADEVGGDRHTIAMLAGFGFDAVASREPLGGAAFVLADPFTQPHPEGVVGWASAGRAPGGNRLVLHDAIHDDGAVHVAVDGIDVHVTTGRVRELLDRPHLSADGALVFTSGGVRDAAVLAELVGSPIAGIGAGPGRAPVTVLRLVEG